MSVIFLSFLGIIGLIAMVEFANVMGMEKQFIHLRTHSRFSVGASTLTIKKIPALCLGAGMGACALTDTNLMSGCAEFSDVMPKNKVQPIIGIEISLNQHNADPKILRSESLSKVVLLAQMVRNWFSVRKSFVVY